MSGRGIADRYTRLTVIPVLLILTVVLFILCSPANASSTVHGSVYEWSTFSTINNAVIEVNSVPGQVMVSKSGSYSFTLKPGTYVISAKAVSSGSSSALFATENVTIDLADGDYVIDLILFPESSLEGMDLIGENVTSVITDEPSQPAGNDAPAFLIAAVLLISIIAGIALFMVIKKRKKSDSPGVVTPAHKNDDQTSAASEIESQYMTPSPSDNEVSFNKAGDSAGISREAIHTSQPGKTPVSASAKPLPEDLKELVNILRKNGGRMTQLDLRKALPYSEAKVSLLVTDLENRGIVK